ncbi:MAG: rhombosortase [Gammaproteobacteria bacterium]|nr:rhombosortase [Gammaproteobacteria bacterium]
MGLHKIERSAQDVPETGLWLLPGILLAIAILLSLGGETALGWFRFDRGGIGSGEVWRLVTGHLVHLGWPHFALNAVGLLLVWYLVGNAYNWREWLLVSMLAIVTMDIGFWVFEPGLAWYVGLSGLLHGMLAAGLVAKLRHPDKETLALAILLLGKLVWEQVSGPLPGSESTSGGSVIVDSHLYGALGGVLAAILLRIRVRPTAPI